MIIREAKRNDIAYLSALAKKTYTKAFGHSFTVAELKAELEKARSCKYFDSVIDKDTILVVDNGERLVGYVQISDLQISVDSATDKDRELHALYVDSDFQGQGIGSLLMDAILENPCLKQIENIYLDVWEHNHGAQKLYSRYGFVVVGENRFISNDGKEGDLDLIMVRHLKND